MKACIALLLALLTACAFAQEDGGSHMTFALRDDERVIYLAGGCFWGVEKLMSLVPGVTDAVSGYANGTLQNPTYAQVRAGGTGHRETVRVTYRPDAVSLADLLSLYFSAVDTSVQNRQGGDVGTQYQTGIYYTTPADEAVVRAAADREREKTDAFYVEIKPLLCFYQAEPEHQDYLDNHPGGYCHVSLDAFARAKALEPTVDQSALAAAYHRVTPAQAKAWLEEGMPLTIADVRTKREYDEGHITGALLLPLDGIKDSRPDALPGLHGVILVYCRSGVRSRDAANRLVAMGYTAVYDLGGIIDWPYETTR